MTAALTTGGRTRALERLGPVALGFAAVGAALVIPQSDVALYHRYALGALHGAGRTLPREYPAAATAVFALPLLAPGSYRLDFALLMAATYALLAFLGSRWYGGSWLTRASWYLGAAALPELFARYDLVPALLVLVAVHDAQGQRWGRAWVAAIAGAALKIFPILLLPGFLLAEWRQRGRVPWRRVAATAAVIGGGLALQSLLAPGSVLSPLRYEWRRGFEFSSVPGSLSALLDPFHLSWREGFGAIEVHGGASAAIGHGAAGLELVLLLAVWGLSARRRLDVAEVAVAVMSIAVLCDRAFAPQYLIWLAPLWALFPLRRSLLLAALLTGVTYPLAVEVGLVHFHSLVPATATALLRNAVMVLATALWLRGRLRAPAGADVAHAVPCSSRVDRKGAAGGTRTKEDLTFALDGH